MPERGVLHLRRHELARIARGRFRLADRAVHVDRWNEREVHVRLAVGHVFGHGKEARARRIGEVALGPEAVEEERENAAQRRIQIGVRLALPIEARLVQLAPAKRGEDDVAIDALVRSQGVVGDGRKALGRQSSLCREVFRALVVRREAEHAGPGGRFFVAFREVVLDERGKRRGRHDATSPTMAKVTD